MRFRIFCMLALLTISSLTSPRTTFGQLDTPKCDAAKRPLIGAALRYGPRDGRCEGLYSQQIAGEELGLQSLTRAFAKIDPITDRTIVLSWSSPVTATAARTSSRSTGRPRMRSPSGAATR